VLDYVLSAEAVSGSSDLLETLFAMEIFEGGFNNGSMVGGVVGLSPREPLVN